MKPLAEITVKYPVMESFYTIQGEGIHSGRAAWFIRLGGCDVGCVWCDVKESWNADVHPLRSVEELVHEAAAQPARFVVITGGEPLLHDLTALTNELHAAGFEIALETSGSSPLSGSFDWICVSPKKFKRPLTEVLAFADELKVVVYHPSDLQWAEEHAALCKQGCALLLQPEYSRFKTMTPLITSFVLQHPLWRISLQSHKVIGIP